AHTGQREGGATESGDDVESGDARAKVFQIGTGDGVQGAVGACGLGGEDQAVWLGEGEGLDQDCLDHREDGGTDGDSEAQGGGGGGGNSGGAAEGSGGELCVLEEHGRGAYSSACNPTTVPNGSQAFFSRRTSSWPQSGRRRVCVECSAPSIHKVQRYRTP